MWFANVSCCNISSWNTLHIYDTAMILDLCDYPCGKEVSDNVYKFPDSANGSSQKN